MEGREGKKEEEDGWKRELRKDGGKEGGREEGD